MLEEHGREYETALTTVDEAIFLEAVKVEPVELAFTRVEKIESDMDAMDYAVCIVAAIASSFISTSEAAEEWLAKVHDAASGKTDDFDFIQMILGEILYHKGDAIDRFESYDGDKYYVMFHRLLYGHDILSTIGGLQPDNPFLVMVNDKGVGGVFQATKHLIADTCSQQGLPLPGSSYFDSRKYDPESGRKKPWNHLIDFVQELSNEAYGNKGQAGEIYKHLLTIRAQDFAGGMAAKAITAEYLKIRNIQDEVRAVQIRLVAYSLSFYGEAIVGASKQKGIPYINYPLGLAMGKEFAALLIASNKRTLALESKTKELHGRAGNLIGRHDLLSDLLIEDCSNTYIEDEPNER